MISLLVTILFLFADSAFSYGTDLKERMDAEEGSCVAIRCGISPQNTQNPGYIIWLKNAAWNYTIMDFEGTVVYSLIDNRPAHIEFKNRVKYVAPSMHNPVYQLTISNLNLEDSGRYCVRYYRDPTNPSDKYKWQSNNVTLQVQENPCQVSVTEPELVQEGATVILQCSTSLACKTGPEWRTTKWPRSIRGQTPDSYGQSVKRALLNISTSWWHDGMMFSCWPQYSNDKCAARHVKLAVEYCPKDTKSEVSPSIVKEGGAVTLTCQSKGNPKPVFSWFKVGGGDTTEGTEWKFPAVQIKDDGGYFCQAENKHGLQNSTVIRLDVKYAPKGVRIISSVSLDWITMGDPVNLTCGYQKSNPAVSSYSWYHNGNLLTMAHQVHHFKAIRPEDSGSYQCIANNLLGHKHSANVAVNVYYGPRNMRITASCGDGGVKAGHRLSLTCEADALPEPYGYTWYHTAKWRDGRSSGALPQRGRTLSWELIAVRDAGEYMCQAVNNITTQNSTTLRIDVLYRPTGLALTLDPVVREFDRVTICCSVESFPFSHLTLAWAPHSKPRERKAMTHSNHSSANSLTYSFNASITDAGLYTCKARNSEGDNEVTRELVVKYAPRDVRVTANPSGEVTEKENLDLTCRAQANPNVTAYIWLKSRDGKVEEVGHGPVLTLGDLSEAHSGMYLCRTSNEIAEGSSHFINITVKYGPKNTEVIHNMTSRGQPVKENAVAMMCRSQSYPLIHSYKWYIQTAFDAERYVAANQNLTIGPDKEGIYYCRVENSVSSSNSDKIEILFYKSNAQMFTMMPAFIFPSIFIITLIIILVYRKRRRISGQQGPGVQRSCCHRFSFLDSRNGTRETLVMDTQRSRESLSAAMASPLEPPANQHCPGSTPCSSIHTVYSVLRVSGEAQQPPPFTFHQRERDGHTDENLISYASLHFQGTMNSTDPKPKQSTDSVYSKASRPKRKNKEEEGKDYENMKGAVLRQRGTDTEMSEEEEEDRDVSYSVISFPVWAGPQGRRRRHRHGEDTSSDEDDYTTQYSDVKV
ncbi:hypothetical protein AAFF_G00328930 [Aldrovandia affinis]|uniref:B-cell receptor CD22 n=1 Tax=Aldrovandia affinis TaxID=143900 RepID=A0AAD7SLP5_9TELE|nr:hypothetical protein AAFF_G00328930 [Aldrovandia affinis]